MTRILKRKDFVRWQVGERLPDVALCKAVKEMEDGLIARDEKRALQFAGKVFLELSGAALSKALLSGVLLEVHCEQDH